MDARNSASAALARRVGLRLEAHHIADWFSKGEWTDTLVFAQLASDFIEPSGQTNPNSPLLEVRSGQWVSARSQ